jgi:Abnormal spindle-like microcephaly-assoc'd, ASPM-SPD-2-Hydin
VTLLSSSYYPCRRRSFREIDGPCAGLVAIFTCVLFAALAGCGYSPNQSTSNPFSISPSTISFGAVPVGKTVTTAVLLLNESSTPIDVSQLNVSDQNFFVNSQSKLPATINAGGVYNFEIGFKPGTNSNYSGQFTVTTTSGIQIGKGTITGSGVSSGNSSAPVLTVSASSLIFGNVTLGSASTQPLTLTSTGSAPVIIDSASLSGSGFTLSGATFPATLNPGQSATLQVQFNPMAAGPALRQLTIQSNSSTNATTVVDVSGTGTTATATTNPELTVSAASLTFGNVTVDSTSEQPVTLTSTGTAPVTINSATLSGDEFTASGVTLPTTLNPGQSVTVNVQFHPTVTGGASGRLTIQSNSSTNGTAVVNLSGTGTAVPSPQLSVSAASLSFGNVTVNTSSTQPLTVTSTGTAPVTINSATPSGAGFTVSGAAFPATLNPGQSVTLNVRFDPTATAGASGQLTIQSDSSTNSTAIVNLSGTGTAAPSPQLTVSAASLNFGDVTVNTSSTQPVTLTATGTAPVTINSATPSGAGFTVSGATFPATLNPGQSVTLNVRFDPTTTAGASGQLTIQSDSSTNSTAVVNLSGTGTAASTPQLTVSVASLTFGNVTLNTSSTQPVTLTSTGTAPVTVNSATPSGTGYSFSGATLPVTLNPGESLSLNVVFNPTVTGAAMGQLTIQSDSSTNSTAVVTLSGTGTAALSPQLTVSAASVNFGDVTVNTSSTKPVTLTSTGTAPVTINSATAGGAGFTVSGATFPATLNPGQSLTVNVQFDPASAVAATGQLTIQSNSSTNSTAVVTLSGTGTAALSPQLTLSVASLTFGNVTVNTSSTKPVTLTSTGTAPVTINSATASGAGFTVSGSTFPATLNPGQSLTVNIQFDPASAVAETGQLTLQSNSPSNGTAVVTLNGTGTAALSPQLTVSVASLTFGNVTVNTSSTKPVTLTSTGTAPVTINSATASGAGFTVSGATFPATLNPGQSLMLNVQFDPASADAETGQLAIQSNSSTNSTAVVTLSGTGTAALSPQLTVSVTRLTFGSVTLNTPSTQSVTLTSTGTAPVTINSATLSGAGFTMSGATFPVTLNPNLAVTLEIQFDPTAAGAVTGQLTIQSNSTTNATALISLTGTGQTAASHEVDLSWSAPASSVDPIVGYNIYRSTGSSGYQLVNSSVDTQTTYVDSSVQTGSTYDYVVESVDAEGVESVPSNQATATVP